MKKYILYCRNTDMYMYAIKCLALINQDHSCYFFLVHCFENMTSNKQTQGFGRVVHVFAIHTLVAGEAALLSQKVLTLIQSNLLGHFEK